MCHGKWMQARVSDVGESRDIADCLHVELIGVAVHTDDGRVVHVDEPCRTYES